MKQAFDVLYSDCGPISEQSLHRLHIAIDATVSFIINWTQNT